MERVSLKIVTNITRVTGDESILDGPIGNYNLYLIDDQMLIHVPYLRLVWKTIFIQLKNETTKIVKNITRVTGDESILDGPIGNYNLYLTGWIFRNLHRYTLFATCLKNYFHSTQKRNNNLHSTEKRNNNRNAWCDLKKLNHTWRCWGSNLGPPTCKARALPLSYSPLCE